MSRLKPGGCADRLPASRPLSLSGRLGALLCGSDGEHGARRSADDSPRDAAQEEVLDASPPMGPHDNEVYPFRFGVFRDLDEGRPCPYRPCHVNPGDAPGRLFQLLFNLGFDGLLRRLDVFDRYEDRKA